MAENNENTDKTSFSQRMGITPIRQKIQKERVDEALRNRLWSLLLAFYWLQPTHTSEVSRLIYPQRDLIYRLWTEYFKLPIDELQDFWAQPYRQIRDYFFSCEWFDFFNFLEFVVKSFVVNNANQDFMAECNKILTEEASAYRFILKNKRIVEITSETEIVSIEEALTTTASYSCLKNTYIHLDTAIERFGSKTAPDYRNSVKESISAVESICQLIAGKNASLGDALKIIEKKGKITFAPPFRQALDKLYGYTSSASGIRHALSDQSAVEPEDAKFMLVACSSFVNYLIEKAIKSGIKLN